MLHHSLDYKGPQTTEKSLTTDYLLDCIYSYLFSSHTTSLQVSDSTIAPLLYIKDSLQSRH